MNKNYSYGLLYNKDCAECGRRIPVATNRGAGVAICDGCMNPKPPSCGSGSVSNGHWDDDPSGASGSWDNAVKLQETR